MGESFETSVPWDKVFDLCRNVKELLQRESKKNGIKYPILGSARLGKIPFLTEIRHFRLRVAPEAHIVNLWSTFLEASEVGHSNCCSYFCFGHEIQRPCVSHERSRKRFEMCNTTLAPPNCKILQCGCPFLKFGPHSLAGDFQSDSVVRFGGLRLFLLRIQLSRPSKSARSLRQYRGQKLLPDSLCDCMKPW